MKLLHIIMYCILLCIVTYYEIIQRYSIGICCILGVNCYSFVVPTRPIIIICSILNNTFIWLWIILHRRTIAILNLLYECAFSYTQFRVNIFMFEIILNCVGTSKIVYFFSRVFSYRISSPLTPPHSFHQTDPFIQHSCLNILMYVWKRRQLSGSFLANPASPL